MKTTVLLTARDPETNRSRNFCYDFDTEAEAAEFALSVVDDELVDTCQIVESRFPVLH